jgi:G6PDH family F420-dependent oxidoreductase
MARIGCALASEEHGPSELVRQAILAEEAGFDALWISDHYHPWNDEQGQSPFVWSTIGAISQITRLPVTTAVTCPTMRIHPAIVAQAAATSAILLDGRFALGVGTGEALNEHILGDRWPAARERLAMLEEAVEVMRALWRGDLVNHRGPHYTVENARLYTLPDSPPRVFVSGFGPAAAKLAGRIGDGFCTTMPDPALLAAFREAGGEGKPSQAGTKACWAVDEAAARKTAHRLWSNMGVPGELTQLLPTPRHFQQATQLVTEDMIARTVPCGNDPRRHIAALRAYLDAGYDEVFVQQIGPEQDGFFEFYAQEVLPEVR